MMPRVGGEYVYLRETYGPAVGFMSAFVSLVAGFSAPVAAAAKSFAIYLGHFFPILARNPTIGGVIPAVDLLAVAIVWLLVWIHARGVRSGTGFNDVITVFKVGGITLIVLAAVAIGRGNVANLTTASASFQELGPTDLFAALGTSLIFVMFCFSGWNAAAYVAGEMENPQRDLPRSLILGTVTVLVLYLGLNAVYFYGADVDALAGQVDVGLVASRTLFGGWGTSLVTVVLCASILASASAMTVAGPRVYYALGKDFSPFALLSRTRAGGAPVIALVVQGAVTSLIILSGRVDQIQQYAGFTVTLFASLAVSCVIVLRIRRPQADRPFRTWGYPLSPLIFLAVAAWTMYWAFRGRPVESTLSFVTVLLGGLAFRFAARRAPAVASGGPPDSGR
jgi:APA family basic amino acid/polyamine antiporter